MSSRTGLRRFVPGDPASGSPPQADSAPALGSGPANGSGPGTRSALSNGASAAPGLAAAAELAGDASAAANGSGIAAGSALATAGIPASLLAAQPLGPPPGAAPPIEKCEMCATEIPAEHGHVADLEQSSLVCACRACYLLFTHSQAGRGRYRAIPDRYLTDPAHVLSVAEWDALEVPIGLAFFLRRSDSGEVTGFYPSPAGATECRLDLGAWDRLAESYPLLAAPAADLEAILISRSEAGVDCFLVPIDACYELAGRMRLLWRGFDGGTEARQAIADFLAALSARARPLSRES